MVNISGIRLHFRARMLPPCSQAAQVIWQNSPQPRSALLFRQFTCLSQVIAIEFEDGPDAWNPECINGRIFRISLR